MRRNAYRLFEIVAMLVFALGVFGCDDRDTPETTEDRLGDHGIFSVLANQTLLASHCDAGDAMQNEVCRKWVAVDDDLESMSDRFRSAFPADSWQFIATTGGELGSVRTLNWRNDKYRVSASFVPPSEYAAGVPTGSTFVLVLVVSLRK